jgi:hypothetical protein
MLKRPSSLVSSKVCKNKSAKEADQAAQGWVSTTSFPVEGFANVMSVTK